MKKLLLPVLLLVACLQVQAQMYTFVHQRTTTIVKGTIESSVEKLSADTIFVDGKHVQIISGEHMMSEKIRKTSMIKNNIVYTLSTMTLVVPLEGWPESITLLLLPDKNGVSYKIDYYIKNIAR